MRYPSEMGARRTVASLVGCALAMLVATASMPQRAAAAYPPGAVMDHGDRQHAGDRGDDRQGREEYEQAPAQRGDFVRGTVVSVDYGRNVLFVDAGGARRRIVLTPTTTLEEAGSRGLSIADLRPGQRVDVYLTIVGGTPIAQIVRLH